MNKYWRNLIVHVVWLNDTGIQLAKKTLKRLYQKPIIEFAHVYRRTLVKATFVGVTGSCGKTTTKDLVAAVLSRQLQGAKSKDSNNNTYAVARAILTLRPWDHFCVQELGAESPGALDGPIALLQPRIGIVNNIGSDHFKAFRTLEAITLEKGRLISALPENGTAVLNADDPNVLALQSRCKGNVLTFGQSNAAMVQAREVTSIWPERLSFTVVYRGVSFPVRTRLCGIHWVSGVLAALGTGLVMGIPLKEAIKGVEKVEPWRGRMYPVELEDGVTFIRDEWKASYWSIPASLEFMRTACAKRKVIVLGTISDYGGTAKRKYCSIARQALDVANHVFFVGQNAHHILKMRKHAGDKTLNAFETVKKAADFLQYFLMPGDLVLLKGTNPADHLTRIALTRNRKVACWRNRCNRQIFCDHCALLQVPSSPHTNIAHH